MKKPILILILISIFINCEKIEIKQSETMAQQDLNYGTAYNDPSSDSARTTFDKIQDNFDELYADVTAIQATNPNSEIVIILPIGVWNMDTSSDNTVAWARPSGAHITSLEVTIIADDNATERPLSDIVSGTGIPGGRFYYDSSEAGIYMERTTGSVFDSAAYDGSSNRGYVRIGYVLP